MSETDSAVPTAAPEGIAADRPATQAERALDRFLRKSGADAGRKSDKTRVAAGADGSINDSTNDSTDAIAELSPENLAELFVSSLFLASVGQPLIDQHWMRNREGDVTPGSFGPFLRQALRRELAPLLFLAPLLETAGPEQFKTYARLADALGSAISSRARDRFPKEEFRSFAAHAMRGMDRLTRFESRWTGEHAPIFSLYRAFDEMDNVLGLEYELDEGMRADPSTRERLYEGAGAGVQTSYSSLLLALDRIQPAPGARFIDLGSGYGRVGMVLGLLRPDVEFIGYEYVPHRVESARTAAERAGLSGHVRFFAQDLADPEFKIPDADFYFLYDPFTQETYRHVFAQLKEIARHRPITLVTKGRANAWVEAAIEGEGWAAPQGLDEGTIRVFRSSPEAV